MHVFEGGDIMTYFICILALVITLLAFWVKEVSNRMKEIQKGLSEQIRSLKEELGKAGRQHHADRARIAELEKDRSLLAEKVQELEKKLDFYLNIEEDSATLNEHDEPAQRVSHHVH